ncbi:endonuclease/exonuclease/phosphatase family protein [Mycobacterium palustre]|nr:endonuclease/exonuclease/phosphatase family protein [Mycobacterium palustre]
MQGAARTAVALVALGLGCWARASRHLPITNHAVLVTAAFSRYLMPGAAVSAIVLALPSDWILAIAACGLMASTPAPRAPLYRRPHSESTAGVKLRVFSANLRVGQADAELLVRSAREQADLVAFQELTPRAAELLSAAGLDSTFPHRWLDARNGGAGVGIWSRFPMHAAARIDGYAMPFGCARLQVPGVSTDPTVVVVHVAGPWPWPIDAWRRDLRRLPQTLLEVANSAGEGAVIVAGDFNSTTDMRPFRALLHNGYRDAAEQSGAGVVRTFPAGRRLPRLLAIDHVLTRGCNATSLHAVVLPGSDHRGLVATVQIPH